MTSTDQHPLKVVIAGGGVAAIEAALALRELAGERVAVTMLAPEPEFVIRPERVREPFAGRDARRYPLDHIARDLDIELRQDAFERLEPAARVVHTAGGDALPYDALLLALGAEQRPYVSYATTLDDRQLDEQLHGLVEDVEGGYSRKLAFISPSQMSWPLPMYELALMTARRAYDMDEEISVTIVTPEDAPLALFGRAASDAVAKLMVDNGILVIPSAHATVPEAKQVLLHPGGHILHVDRIIALPELFGPSTPGIPKRDGDGFILVDEHCRVPGLDDVFAAGDCTDFPVKHGGIGSQQADVAAASIAALAGAPVEPEKFHPIINGMLIGGDRPLYLSADITGGHGASSNVSDTPLWPSGGKIAAKYLGPYLESLQPASVR